VAAWGCYRRALLGVGGRKKLRRRPAVTAGVALGGVVPIVLASPKPPIAPDDASEALEESGTPPTFTVLVGPATGGRAGAGGDVARQDYRDGFGMPRLSWSWWTIAPPTAARRS
jgi:hypothetical protein